MIETEKLRFSKLQVDDFIPMFTLPAQDGKMREIQSFGGKRVVLFFLPTDFDAFVNDFFNHLYSDTKKLDELDFLRVFICKCSVPQAGEFIKKIKRQVNIWADETGELHKAFGIENPEKKPLSVVLAPSMRIFSMHDNTNAFNQINHVFRSLGELKNKIPAVNPITKMQAPIIVVPNAISEELRQKLVTYWEANKKIKSTVGVEGNERVDTSYKKRTDTDLIDKKLLAEVDDALSKTSYPEIKKVAAFTAKYRERYRIGCYNSEEAGHLNYHRDTGVYTLFYRRFSLVLCLGEEYEGGYLQFPEYDNASYKLDARTAVLFPVPLMHHVTPITSGRRFVLVSFMFGDEGEEQRKKYMEDKNLPYNVNEVKLLSPHSFDDIKESKFLYTSSCK